jgi:cobalt-zinc-cadmium resistance protein CzcA
MTQIPIGAVPDVTNNQVQVITTSRNLATEDVEQFITYPIELEMANLPGVIEIRSITKFGLSVVTVVFEDASGTYLPRQLIAEKLSSINEIIPEGYGTPELGPITTGLGEIYQYILDTKPGYDTVYNTMDLRTIQDWIVKRHLSGIQGVVEVNTWGGYLKQYEVVIDPSKLKAMNVSITEVYEALKNNNQNVGGGYIEKASQSYFVRGEGIIQNLNDINNIVIKNINGIPVKVKDIGDLRFGYATRFGAITGNGEGEKVLGQVMMLKDANSNEVIVAVKERVAEVQLLLPEGVYINPFLDRSELISRTTHTVVENLSLGALIVIFIVVLMLGNIRSGLIIASVIPISMLFGIAMMNLFGISANLMSLGAIDFGIIIDGAVIIVEYALVIFGQHSGMLRTLKGQALNLEKDRLLILSSKKMMRSAIFGRVITLMVFIPILALSGIEGKMFQPMALAFGFALIGSLLLCLTYIPALSALFLKPQKISKNNPAERIMQFAHKMYDPVINYVVNHQRLTIIVSVVLLAYTGWIFSRMGGEFIPTLDEGDFVVQPILKPGTSLSETVDFNTKIEKILIKNFPEVEQVVSRIGAAEVPTDPMSMEMSDIIIKLKPKDEWVTTASKEKLADLMKEKMSVFPGVEYEFTQPIEMRFNELITGVRADVAIKIFGEDYNQLYEYATRIRSMISNVEGASDISVEQIVGLPNMTIKYDRDKLAQYGLNVSDINQIISIAFGGQIAGTIFEGERRFDLKVSPDRAKVKSIEDLENIFLDLPNGNTLPMREVAEVSYDYGPAQISRESAKRRIVVGINVRNRDLESLANEIRGIIETNLNLLPGYYITYGGQFENLQNAKERLLWAVPFALLIIFILLYFTFYSTSQALLIFSAIPLSTIGGILSLWVRGMPFSISAGVGFIALFGIATLNGVVLISFFNDLKEKGIKDLKERVLTGTKSRLRPVLLTAAAAAFGFLPMAFSTSAGAEVQRPLATVVIGGLVSATILTMVVLPVLYCMITKKADHENR